MRPERGRWVLVPANSAVARWHRAKKIRASNLEAFCGEEVKTTGRDVAVSAEMPSGGARVCSGCRVRANYA